MQKRKKELLSNGLLLAAVISDVSNMDLLTPDHTIKGKETLINLVLRQMKKMMPVFRIFRYQTLS